MYQILTTFDDPWLRCGFIIIFQMPPFCRLMLVRYCVGFFLHNVHCTLIWTVL